MDMMGGGRRRFAVLTLLIGGLLGVFCSLCCVCLGKRGMEVGFALAGSSG